MKVRKILHLDTPKQRREPFYRLEANSTVGEIALWIIALDAFVWAIMAARSSVALSKGADLRTPPVMAINMFVVMLIMMGWLLYHASLMPMTLRHSLLYGLWAAAMFRLIPPIMHARCLFFANVATADLPYVVVFALAQGLLNVLVIGTYCAFIFRTRAGPIVDVEIATNIAVASTGAMFGIAGFMRVMSTVMSLN